MPNDVPETPEHAALYAEMDTILLKGYENLKDPDYDRLREIEKILHPERKSMRDRILNEQPGGAGPSKMHSKN